MSGTSKQCLNTNCISKPVCVRSKKEIMSSARRYQVLKLSSLSWALKYVMLEYERIESIENHYQSLNFVVKITNCISVTILTDAAQDVELPQGSSVPCNDYKLSI